MSVGRNRSTRIKNPRRHSDELQSTSRTTKLSLVEAAASSLDDSWSSPTSWGLRITIRGNKQIGGNVLKKTVWGLSRQIQSVIRSAPEQAAYFLSYSGQTGAPGGKTQADTGEKDKTSDRQKKAEKPVFSAVNHWTIVLPSEDLWGFCWHNTRSLENHA